MEHANVLENAKWRVVSLRWFQGSFGVASILRTILEYFGLNTGVFWAQYWSILRTNTGTSSQSGGSVVRR